MKKSIFISTLLTLFCVCYVAVRKGIDIPIGIALIASCLSNALNIAWLISERGKENAKGVERYTILGGSFKNKKPGLPPTVKSK